MNVPNSLGNYQVERLLTDEGRLPDKTLAVHGFQHGAASATDLSSDPVSLSNDES